MDSETGATAVRTMVLAYLGQLRKDEWASAMVICTHLNLRFRTAQRTLALLLERELVEKRLDNKKGTVALFRIHPLATTFVINKHGEQVVATYVPPDWSDAYGKHPHNP